MSDQKKYRFYAVYLAYSKYEVLPDEVCADPEVPLYPQEIARLRVYDNQQSQIDCYANTMCPASQLIEADTEQELNEKAMQMRLNFRDQAWLDEHITPYI